jgi:hypothetical protein
MDCDPAGANHYAPDQQYDHRKIADQLTAFAHLNYPMTTPIKYHKT